MICQWNSHLNKNKMMQIMQMMATSFALYDLCYTNMAHEQY